MLGLRFQKTFINNNLNNLNNPKVFIQNVINNTHYFEGRKICEYVHRNQEKHLSTLCPVSHYFIIKSQKNYKDNISQCASINTRFKGQYIFPKNVHTLQTSINNQIVYQPKRFFGDIAHTSAVTAIHSNAPIGRYEEILLLLSDSVPVQYCQNFLLSLHSETGLPWWATIILVTCAARTTVTLPLSLYQQYIFAKVANLKYEMNDIVKDLKRETNIAVYTYGWTESYARVIYNRSLKKQWNKLIIRDNCHPMKGLVLITVQLPLWIILSASIRNLCFMLPRQTPVAYETFMQLSVEGFGWISDLTAIDSYWILPISLGIVNLLNVEIQALMISKEATTTRKIGINICRCISVLMVPVAGMVPTCVSLYWVTSSVCGFVQSFIIISPRIRRLAKIPESEVELKHPYRHLYDNFKKKYAWIYNKRLT